MADLRVLKDVDTDQPFYPYTVKQAVIDEDGNEVLVELEEEIKDGRKGFDERLYKSIGEAIRAQFEKIDIEKLGYRSYIDKPIDFFNTLEQGVYNIVNSVIPDCQNYPSEVGGILTVVRRTGEDFPAFYQLIDNKGYLYYAYLTQKGWSPWIKYAVETEIETHTDGVGALVNIAESYFDVVYNPEDMMVYFSRHGLFSPQYCCMVDEDGYVLDDDGYRLNGSRERVLDENGKPILGKNPQPTKAIVCSQFEQACIAGISYENSRYVTKDNRNRGYSWGFVSDGSGVYDQTYNYTLTNDADETSLNDYMTACEQARYFENKGMLHTFDERRNGLKPGDLIFFDDPEMDEKDKPYYYRQIVHVGICLTVGEQDYTMMHSSPGLERREMVGSDKKKEAGIFVGHYLYQTKRPAYFVHSPISAEYTSKRLSTITRKRRGNYGNSNSIFLGEFKFGGDEECLERGFYTIQFDDKGDSLNVYAIVTYDAVDAQGNALKDVNYFGAKNGDLGQIVFYAEFPVKNIIVRVSRGQYYDNTWVKLYRGYHP